MGSGSYVKSLPRQVSGSPAALLRVTGWLLVYLVVFAASVAQTPSISAATSLGPSLVALLFSLWGFIVQGRSEINFSSAFSYAAALFLNFPAVYSALGLFPGSATITAGSMLIMVTASIFLQAGIVLASPPMPRAQLTVADSQLVGESADTLSFGKGVVWISVILMVLGCICVNINLIPFGIAAGSLAIYLTAEYVFASRGPVRKIIGTLILVGFSIVFLEVLFSGFGRLLLGAIGCGVIVLACRRTRGGWLKCAMVVGTIPGLIYTSFSRIQYLDRIRDGSVSRDEGIGSVIIPFISTGKIWDQIIGGQLTPSGGGSFMVSFLTWIPRAVWPDKPVGFGLEIVPAVAPQLVGVVGYSDSATILGELLWGFGPLFSIIGVIGLVLLIRSADKWLALQRNSQVDNDVDRLLWNMVGIVLITGLLNLVWGGSYTFASRALPQLAIIAVLWVLARLLAGSRKRRQEPQLRTSGARRYVSRPRPSPLGSSATVHKTALKTTDLRR